MVKFVNIRNKFINISQQKTLCNSYFHDMLQEYQEQPCSKQTLKWFITAVATYIFAPIKNKSLRNNKHLNVIAYAKPKNIETVSNGFYYRQVGVDKGEGPYWCAKTNKYNVDVTYHQWEEIYSIALQNILCEGKHFTLHEYIAYNAWKWGHKFVSFWKAVCRLVECNISYGFVIFVDNKYILISWLAADIELYAYPGYETLVAICGGKQINLDYEYNVRRLNHPASKLYFVNGKMWYISCGESYEIVSTSRSNVERLFAIKCHEKLVVERQLNNERHESALYRLHLGLKKIRRDLKLNKYGEKFHFGRQVGFDVWFNYLQNVLNNLNITVISKGNTHRWTMLIAEANITFCYQNNSYFQRNYDNVQKDIVYLSSMEFSMNTNSGYLRMDAMILKRNKNGLVQGLKRNEKNGLYPKDYYSLDTTINESIFFNVLEFMDCEELVLIQDVSKLYAVLGKLKKMGLKYQQFMVILS
eukprot:278697_1